VKLLLTGACGFAGSTIAEAMLASRESLEIVGVDNFIRAGSELNRGRLLALGVKLVHVDIRSATDVATLPKADWVLDCAANPSVLAGVDGRTSSRQLLEHNLGGTINLLEYCKDHRAGFILLSTSRVYSIAALGGLETEVVEGGFRPAPQEVRGLTEQGVAESFSTAPPISLYGVAKLASEQLALEYGETFGLPMWINRCGVLAGAGQFGKADQGIFSFWIHSWRAGRPLKYIGFGGHGHQVRDCLHPRDLVPVLLQQMAGAAGPRIQNLSGGVGQSMSLRQLSDWCAGRFGPREVTSDPLPRPFDLPWLVLDSSLARRSWPWRPETSMERILEEIAAHAEANPAWLDTVTS
jgi:CDP-paratose 2-epimerase